MPFPLKTPADLTRRAEALMEAALRKARPNVDPAAISRSVRSPRGMIAATIRVMVMLVYELHLHLRWWGDQLFPDTAEAEYLERHASIWGVTRRPATRAIGYATVAGANGATVPVDAVLVGAGGLLYTVTAGATIVAGTATITVRALDAGADGNAAADTRLSFQTDIDGLNPQEAVVDADGLTGGAAIESLASLLARLLAEIREPAHGGAQGDYPKWVQNTFAAARVRTLPNWVGEGTVGVCVAMGTTALPRAPTPAELAAMAAHLEGLRPVTAEVIMVAVDLLAVPITLAVDPDETRVRQAVNASILTHFAADADIGARLYRSRLSEAISAASGEYRHELSVPAADVVPTDIQLPVPGALTWAALP